MKILILNSGSSSLKFELFQARKKSLTSLYKGHCDNHGKPIRNFHAAVLRAVKALPAGDIAVVGHRVVHGGERYTKPTLVTAPVLKTIKKLFPLAPLHNPPSYACIQAAQRIFPNAKHIAVFDTAFHHTMPEKAFLYGIPYAMQKNYGIRRYGFHGISHEYVFQEARKKLGLKKTRRTITCHLGNGSSLAAILNGKVIDTSMGFTPLEGIPMGTRPGDIDPGIIFFLLKQGFSAAEIENIFQKKSGLLGVSEISGDMRDIWAAYKKKNKKALLALDWFAYRIAKYIGAYTAALGGLDCLIFTGGIGEHADYLHKRVGAYLKSLPKHKTLVIQTDEEKKIAQECARLLNL